MRLRIVWLFVVLMILTSNAWAVGHLGPPTAGLNKGQWSIGYNYSYSTQDMDKANITYSNSDGYSEIGKVQVEDFKTQRHYATLSYGMEDWWEIYASIGVADVKERAKETQWPGDPNEYESATNFDNDLAWGWGTKMTFAKQDNVAWGIALQMNWLDTSWDDEGVDAVYGAYKDELNLESYDIVVAVGPTIDFGCWKLYGGPFYYCFNGDYDYKTSWADGFVEKESAKVRADSNFGGYIGAQIPIADNWDFTTEVSMTGDGWGVGGGLAVKF